MIWFLQYKNKSASECNSHPTAGILCALIFHLIYLLHFDVWQMTTKPLSSCWILLYLEHFIFSTLTMWSVTLTNQQVKWWCVHGAVTCWKCYGTTGKLQFNYGREVFSSARSGSTLLLNVAFVCNSPTLSLKSLKECLLITSSFPTKANANSTMVPMCMYCLSCSWETVRNTFISS